MTSVHKKNRPFYAHNLALSQLFCKIAPYYSIIIWRNQIFLLTLRQNINDTIWKNRLLVTDKPVFIILSSLHERQPKRMPAGGSKDFVLSER